MPVMLTLPLTLAEPLENVLQAPLVPTSSPASASGDTLAPDAQPLLQSVLEIGLMLRNEMLKPDSETLSIVKMLVFVLRFLDPLLQKMLLLVCVLTLGLVLVANGTPLSGLEPPLLLSTLLSCFY